MMNFNNINKNDENNRIKVYFKFRDISNKKSFMIIIFSNFDEKVSDLVKKYLLKTNQRSHEVKFVFNAKSIKS